MSSHSQPTIKRIDFNPDVHHPAAEILSHTCSPLSAALAIWAIHKSWQRPFMRTYFQARWITFTSHFRPKPSVPSSIHVEHKQHTPSMHLGMNQTPITKASALAAVVATAKPITSTSTTAVPTADAFVQTVASDVDTANLASSIDLQSLVPNLYAAVPNLAEKLQTLYKPEDWLSVTEHLHDLFSCVWMTDIMNQLHAMSGLPWWFVIALSTVFFRIAVMPIFIFQQRNSLRMAKAAPEIKELQHKLDTTKDPHEKQTLSAKFLRVLKDHDATPIHQWYVPILFPSVFLSYFGSVHNLCMIEPSMALEGLWWFQNLTVPDPTFLLPIFSALTWLAVMELGGGRYYIAWPLVRTLCRLLTVAFIPLTMTLPAGIFMFWIPANIYAMVRALAMRTNTARAIFGVPIEKEIQSLLHLPKRVPPMVWPDNAIMPKPKNSMTASELFGWLKYYYEQKHGVGAAAGVQSHVAQPHAPLHTAVHSAKPIAAAQPTQAFSSEAEAAVASTSVKV